MMGRPTTRRSWLARIVRSGAFTSGTGAGIGQEHRGSTHHGRARGFIDADDRLRPDALAIRSAVAGHPACALVWGRCVRIDEHGRELPTVPPPPVAGDAYEALLRNNFIWTPAVVMFRRSVCGPFMRFNPAVDAPPRLRALLEDRPSLPDPATQQRWLNIDCTGEACRATPR